MSKDDLFMPSYGCITPTDIYDRTIDRDEFKPFYGCIAVDENSGFGTKIANSNLRKRIVHLIDELNKEVSNYKPNENERLDESNIFEIHNTLMNYRDLFDDGE